MRRRVPAIPSRVAPQVFAAASQVEVHAILELACFEALEELSRDGTPPPLQA